jgi:hypothetical protein
VPRRSAASHTPRAAVPGAADAAHVRRRLPPSPTRLTRALQTAPAPLLSAHTSCRRGGTGRKTSPRWRRRQRWGRRRRVAVRQKGGRAAAQAA